VTVVPFVIVSVAGEKAKLAKVIELPDGEVVWVYDKYQIYLPALVLFTGLIIVFAVALVFARPPQLGISSRTTVK